MSIFTVQKDCEMNELFLDTSYAVALAVRTDPFHHKARAISSGIELKKAKLVTTRAIALEIGNSLAKQRQRPGAVQLLDSLDSDPRIEVVPLSDSLYRRGFDLFRQRMDKEWGLTDCISFLVMQDRGLTDSLTTDHHFEQAGFRALLLN